MSPLPADPLEEALILLFSGVLKELSGNNPEVEEEETPEI